MTDFDDKDVDNLAAMLAKVTRLWDSPGSAAQAWGQMRPTAKELLREQAEYILRTPVFARAADGQPKFEVQMIYPGRCEDGMGLPRSVTFAALPPLQTVLVLAGKNFVLSGYLLDIGGNGEQEYRANLSYMGPAVSQPGA